MRAAHSLKGAARIVGVDAGVSVAHVMEDCLVSAQEGRLLLRPEHIDAAARHRPADAHRHAEQCPLPEDIEAYVP
jgi:two-component system sensor histidine kinase and response regulator WspE